MRIRLSLCAWSTLLIGTPVFADGYSYLSGGRFGAEYAYRNAILPVNSFFVTKISNVGNGLPVSYDVSQVSIDCNSPNIRVVGSTIGYRQGSTVPVFTLPTYNSERLPMLAYEIRLRSDYCSGGNVGTPLGNIGLNQLLSAVGSGAPIATLEAANRAMASTAIANRPNNQPPATTARPTTPAATASDFARARQCLSVTRREVSNRSGWMMEGEMVVSTYISTVRNNCSRTVTFTAEGGVLEGWSRCAEISRGRMTGTLAPGASMPGPYGVECLRSVSRWLEASR